MILNDSQINKLAVEHDMIEHFVPITREVNRISYGLTSFGYDMRLGTKFQMPYRPITTANFKVDPKHTDNWDEMFTEFHSMTPFYIPPQTFILGVSVEKFNLPDDVWGMVVGKSTYARCGIFVNTTPMEPAWSGYLTIELYNSLHYPVLLYPSEGIAQVSFFRGEPPMVNYRTKSGKYQNQPSHPVKPAIKRQEQQ
jgi:dCTP deaminase